MGKVDGLTVKAYRGDNATLLAFDVDESLKDDLAGFAVEVTTPKGDTFPLTNRLTFGDPIVAATTPAQRRRIATDTSKAPLQKFHWVHFPRDITPGTFTYRTTAMRFKAGSEDRIEPGPQASATVELLAGTHARLRLGFTRGFVSSQAYADEFDNAPIVPKPQTIDFDTKPFERAYAWLGFGARRLVFDLLDETIADPQLELDVFAFDLDEPDVIRRLAQLGPRLRLFLDDSSSHDEPDSPTAAPPPELAARKLLERTAGPDNVKAGHFGGLAHCKVLIQRRGDVPVKVLSGSANFTVRGLYVQSNNVFVFDDPQSAALYEQAFEQAWTKPLSQFDTSEIASRWFEREGDGLPPFAVSFAPHAKAAVSLERVAGAIEHARSSVLFAIMELGAGKGPVLDEVRALPGRRELYAFGTTQRLNGSLKVTSPADPDSPFIPFRYLKAKVPEPFRSEVSGGSGQVIHHKFVVCDFNDASPLVFAGSSNLAAGGETGNGDNLVAFADREVATTYAVQAIGLTDHYRFRAKQSKATKAAPLRLRRRSEDWTRDYFDPASARFRERELFAHPPAGGPH